MWNEAFGLLVAVLVGMLFVAAVRVVFGELVFLEFAAWVFGVLLTIRNWRKVQ